MYKHIIAAAAQENQEGYLLAGGYYVRVGVITKLVLMVPISIITSFYMPTILVWIGYEGEIVRISRSFAAVASFSQIMNMYVTLSSNE